MAEAGFGRVFEQDFAALPDIATNRLFATIAQTGIFVYGSADNQGTPMRRSNLIHQYSVEAAAPTMFGGSRPQTKLVNVGPTDAFALAGGRI